MRILIILIGFCCFQLQANPSIHEKFTEYSITPKSIYDLRASLNRASPVRQNGDTFHAYTDTDVSWKFWKHRFNNKCILNEIKTKVDITYTLPKLKQSHASKPILKIWNQYSPALIKHEKGHGQIAIDAAKQIEEVLAQLPAADNCSLLDDQANQKARSILNSYINKHKTYDQITGHGSTQGADLGLYLE